jgi:hypothetical protein
MMDAEDDRSRLYAVEWYTQLAQRQLWTGACREADAAVRQAVRLAMDLGPDDAGDWLGLWLPCLRWSAQRLCQTHGHDMCAVCTLLGMMDACVTSPLSMRPRWMGAEDVPYLLPPAITPCCCTVPVNRCS